MSGILWVNLVFKKLPRQMTSTGKTQRPVSPRFSVNM